MFFKKIPNLFKKKEKKKLTREEIIKQLNEYREKKEEVVVHSFEFDEPKEYRSIEEYKKDEKLKKEPFETVFEGIDEFNKDFKEPDFKDINSEEKNIEFSKINKEKIDVKKEILDLEKEILDVKEDYDLEEPKKLDIEKHYINTIPTVFKIALVASGVVFIITAVSAFMVFSNSKENINNKNNIVSEPMNYNLNSSNYIYINQQANFKRDSLKLNKMLLDHNSITFYFDEKLELSKFEFELIDNNNKRYVRDIPFSDFEDWTFKAENSICFESLSKDAKTLKLVVRNIKTNEESEFNMDLSKGLPTLNAKYLDAGTEVYKGAGYKIDLGDCVFSSSGSIINYSISWDNPLEMLYIGDGEFSANLKEGSTNIIRKYKYPQEFAFENENIIIGRLDFDPVMSLDSELKIIFNDVYKKTRVSEVLDIESLFKDIPQIIENGKHKIIIERVLKQGNKIVVVLHGENLENENSIENRVETRLDLDLVSYDENRIPKKLKGEIKSSGLGTDIVFELPDNMNLNYIELNLNSISIKQDPIIIPINLDKALEEVPAKSLGISNELVNAFESRLAYKSGFLKKEEIIGFSDEVLKNRGLMNNYNQNKSALEPIYNVKVLGKFVENDNIHAVLAETWQRRGNSEVLDFYNIHTIMAEWDWNKEQYIIIEDHIIN